MAAADAVVSQSQSLTSTFLTLLFISLLLAILGFVLAFDVRGLSSRSFKENTGFSYWGKKHEDLIARLPNPFKLVGWIFFLAGLSLLLVIIISVLVKYA